MNLLTLGPAGTFSHEAAIALFPDATIDFAKNFDELFEMLQKSPERIGLVPIENSLHGSVDEVLDLLCETDVRIHRTHDVDIRHAFGAKDPETIVKIASHHQALRQCRTWLKEYYPHAEHFPVSSTAFAVDMAAKDSSFGAIASLATLEKAGIPIVAKDIQGNGNTTRFGLVSVHDPYPDAKRTQMSVVLHPTEDKPGLLHLLLTPFKIYDVNLSRIESRPTGKKLGDYVFFVDFFGQSAEARTQKVFEELRKLAEIKILGEW